MAKAATSSAATSTLTAAPHARGDSQQSDDDDGRSPKTHINHKEQQGPQAKNQSLQAPAAAAAIAPDDSWLQLGIATLVVALHGRLVELQLFSDRPSSLASATSRPIGPAQMGYGPIGPLACRSRRRRLGGAVSAGGACCAARVMTGGGTARREGQQGVGVWFLLKAAENQVREPFLPQIPKSFIRIKDGRMTVRLLMKYLVKKLGLDDESEVQITCRGQPLLPFFTLQHVRDHIWCLSGAVAFLPDSPSTDHVMTLQYGRSR
ncbi:uncharacterized protein A4U43_C02F12240 [Asparagus officinalis]|uniref:Ubiquitin-like domain-containing protein n=1 Tax=Asparagus officinalis TaxID=4686 RepID=A0A5P1FHP6_ASPOF|nr:uncharacterized protein A4U43_C02F12240 [Asparagus officinalis]